MPNHPRNVRCKEPRPVVPSGPGMGPVERFAPGSTSQRAYRYGMTGTPTPPPVTLSIGPDGDVVGSDLAPPEQEPTSSDSRADSRFHARTHGRPWRLLLRRWLMLGLALTAVGFVVGGLRQWPQVQLSAALRSAGLRSGNVGRAAAAAMLAGTSAVATASAPHEGPFRIIHEGYVPIDGGLLIAPDTFAPEVDGSYDLLIHFHGDVGVVRESVEHAGINAALAIINLGVMSGVYRDAYSGAGLYEDLLDEIDGALVQRGVIHPHRRRVALSAWSAGYAAIGSILRNRQDEDWLDAIIVLDGIHAGWRQEAPGHMNPRPLEAFVEVARAATEGKLLFTITHSEIEPPNFAGSRDTAAYLLKSVGATPDDDVMLELPPHLKLQAAKNAVSKRREKRMIPYSDTRVGSLHVRGYQGDTREHHMAHLLQMAATALPELAERWTSSPP